MDYIMLGFFGLIIFILFLLQKINKKNVETKNNLENNKKIALIRSSSNFTSNPGINQNTGILGAKIKNKPEAVREKAAKWVETKSYEEDIKNQDTDFTPLRLNDNKICILLVDDSLVVRKYVGDLLRKQNYELIIKNDGFEAITYLNRKAQKPDLIITDIEMPNMNGAELVDAIRKENKYNSIPILVITAHAESYLDLMESENIQGFIKKPFEDSDLIAQTGYLINNFN